MLLQIHVPALLHPQHGVKRFGLSVRMQDTDGCVKNAAAGSRFLKFYSILRKHAVGLRREHETSPPTDKNMLSHNKKLDR